MAEPASNPMFLDIPRRCGECGYELTGLAETAQCPECGKYPYLDELVLFGWSDRGLGTTASSGGLRKNLITDVPYILLALYAVTVSRSWLLAILCLGSMFLIRTWSLWKRWTLMQDSAAPAQVRFSMQGFGERMGVGTVKLNPWKITHQIEITRTAPDRIRIRLGDPGFSKRPGRGIDFLVESRAEPEAWAKVLRGFRDRGLRAYCGVNAKTIDE